MAFDRVWGDKINKTVILDTSAILMFFEFSIDWKKELDRLLGGYRLVIPSMVKQELQVLAHRSMGPKTAAAAFKLIAQYETVEEATDSADDACMRIAEKTKGIVVTNDTELRKRLRNHGIPVIFLRGKKRLIIEE